jgi:hypothetical protein
MCLRQMLTFLQSDFWYLLDRHCWNRSEAHRQAVALRRAPAYHPHHHRPSHCRQHMVCAGMYYSRDSQSSPVAHRAHKGLLAGVSNRPGYICNANGSCSQCLYGSLGRTNGRTGGATIKSQSSLHSIRSSRQNFKLALEYSSYSEV